MRSLCTILCLVVFSQGLKAATLRVGTAQQFKTIRSAIAAAQNGDTILVDQGTYREQNIVIDKEIVFKGIDHPVLDGEKKYEVLSVKANNVVVDGFKVIKSGVSSIIDMGGIKVYDAEGVTIINNILEETFFGVYIQYGKNCSVINNKLHSSNRVEQQSGNGIHCWKSDSLLIMGNSITGHRDGMYFEFATNYSIVENTSLQNIRYGLHFMFSHNNFYISNVFTGNGAGVAVMYSRSVKMFNNHFDENWGDAAYGLLLKEITDSYIEGNTFERNTIGIYMEGASRINISRNQFLKNGWAMKMQASCMDLEVTRNNFVGNTFDVGTNGSLVLNHFANNYWDKYEGYDINRDRVGDIPYRPVSLYAMIIEQNPPAMILFRSFMASLLDKTEKVLPSITPENLKDDTPFMKPIL